MLYPQRNNAKKTDSIIKTAILLSVIIGFALLLINQFTTPDVRWAEFCVVGILYIWLTVKYALNKNINIASHLFIQMIAISTVCVYLDMRMGFRAWSINIAIPIIVTVINVTMLVLSIVSYNSFMRYAFFQLLIVFASFIPIFLVYENMINNKSLSIIATGISMLNLIISLLFHYKDLKTEVIRKFHV